MKQQEILFKAKRKDNGERIEGNLIKVESGDTYIFNYYFIPGISVPSSKFVEVVPETVARYIGLECHNDKPLFNGDVLQSRDGKDVYRKDTIYFENGSYFIEEGLTVYKYLKESETFIEKIGNIHD